MSNPRTYTLHLAYEELQALEFAADIGCFPDRLISHLASEMAEGMSDIKIPENIAWELLFHKDQDPGAHLACIGNLIKQKIEDLEQEIV